LIGQHNLVVKRKKTTSQINPLNNSPKSFLRWCIKFWHARLLLMHDYSVCQRHKMHHRRAVCPPAVHFVPQTNWKIVHQKKTTSLLVTQQIQKKQQRKYGVNTRSERSRSESNTNRTWRVSSCLGMVASSRWSWLRAWRTLLLHPSDAHRSKQFVSQTFNEVSQPIAQIIIKSGIKSVSTAKVVIGNPSSSFEAQIIKCKIIIIGLESVSASEDVIGDLNQQARKCYQPASFNSHVASSQVKFIRKCIGSHNS